MSKLKLLSALMLFIASSVALSSCSDDEKDAPSNPSIPKTKTMTVGDTWNIGANGVSTTDNDFIVSVTNKSVAKAEHVGDCIISNGQNKCKVSVKGRTVLYKDPITQWGISKSQLISICGNDYIEQNGNIGYKNNDTTCPMVAYMFKNNALSGVGVLVSTDKSETLAKFLVERYLPVEQSGYEYYFVNNNNPSKVTTAVMLSFYNADYWMVTYVPANKSRASFYKNSAISAMLSKMISI